MALPKVGLDTKYGFSPQQGESAKDYMKRDSTFSFGPGGGDRTWNAKLQQWSDAKPNVQAAAPLGGLAGAVAAPAAGGGTAIQAGGGAGGGETDSSTMAVGAGLMGMGDDEGEAMYPPMLGPGLRQGLGQRAYPRMNPALAGLGRAY